jgi:hypothetical protein
MRRPLTMTRRHLAPVLAILLVPGVALAQNFGVSPTAALRVAVRETIEGPRGPVITGAVHNDSPNIVLRVRLHVKVLDASGRLIGESDGVVPGEIAPFGQGQFQVPLAQAGARYDVTVVHADVLDRKGM